MLQDPLNGKVVEGWDSEEHDDFLKGWKEVGVEPWQDTGEGLQEAGSSEVETVLKRDASLQV